MLTPPSLANGFGKYGSGALFSDMRLDLLGAWAPFLGWQGDILEDLSGNHNDGVLTNMSLDTVWQPNDSLLLPGMELRTLDADNDGVYIGQPSIFDVNTMTVLAMFKPTDAATGIVVSRRDNTAGVDGRWDMRLTGAGSVGAQIRANGTFPTVISSLDWGLTEYMHACFQWVDDILALWINGQYVDSDTTGNTQTLNPNNDIILLNREGYTDSAGINLLYAFIYGRALTDAEIKLDAQYGAAALWLEDEIEYFNPAVPGPPLWVNRSNLRFA